MRLCKMTLKAIISSVRIGFRQGDHLSRDFFNLMLSHNNSAVFAAFSSFEKEAWQMGILVNEDSTKYLLLANKSSHRLGDQLTVITST